MKTRSFVAHLIFTTHWDREWVQTFEQYRFRLVNLMDNLLDILEAEPSLIFTLDGQVIVVEDYLEVRPEQKRRLQALAQEGRLVLGPWYVLGDQFLEGDEATVRNLLIGFAFCQAYGGPMLEGYVPDSFGSISSLPLILNGFGIRYANFGRGAAGFPADKSNVCRWQSADGSEVLAFNHGYANAIGITYPDVWRDLTKGEPNAESVRARAARLLHDEGSRGLRPLYLNAGIDHMEMRPGMSKWIELLNESTDAEWISSTPFAFATALKNDLEARSLEPPKVCGEMRGSKESPMNLQGVLSTNREVKRLNRLCEILLARVLEPLNVAQTLSTRFDYHASLTHAWKLVLQNHPHDSICGCSIDAVMQDVRARFRRVLELYEITQERMLRNVLGTSFASAPNEPIQIALFNSVPHRGTTSFDLLVRVPRRLEQARFSLRTKAGTLVGTALVQDVRTNDLETFYATNKDLLKLECKRPPADRESSETLTLLRVQGTFALGASLGWSVVELAEFEPKTESNELSRGANWISNSLLKATTDEKGQILLQDARTGQAYGHLFWFEDSADLGDSYDYEPLEGSAALIASLKNGPLTKVVDSQAEARLTLSAELDIPLTSTRQGRDSSTARHEIELTLSLRPGEKMLRARIRFENRSINHRLRVGFRFAEEPELFSGGHFTAIERNFGTKGDLFPCRPMTDYLHLGFTWGGLGILTNGLYEFEPRKAPPSSEIYITLCRSTNSVGPAAGCNYAIDHAKELGRHEIELAVALSGSVPETIRHSLSYSVPLVGEVVASTDPSSLGPLLSVDNPDIILSALKRAEDGHGFIIRLYNPKGELQTAVLELHLSFQKMERIELSEEISTKGRCSRSGSKITISFDPHEVISLRVV